MVWLGGDLTLSDSAISGCEAFVRACDRLKPWPRLPCINATQACSPRRGHALRAAASLTARVPHASCEQIGGGIVNIFSENLALTNGSSVNNCTAQLVRPSIAPQAATRRKPPWPRERCISAT